jgi:hypothetical protein
VGGRGGVFEDAIFTGMVLDLWNFRVSLADAKCNRAEFCKASFALRLTPLNARALKLIGQFVF